MAQRLVNLTDEDIGVIKDMFAGHPELYSITSKVVKKLDRSQQRIKHSSAKGKGMSFQFFCCEWVSKLLNIPFNQQDDDSLIHSRISGLQGCDVVLRGEARKRFIFDIEAKATKGLVLQDAVEQAEKNAGVDRLGVVFYRQTNMKTFVAMSLDVFEHLCKRFLIS